MSFIWSSIRNSAIVSAVIDRDELYWMRYFRRKYSSLFHTPLPDVEKMSFSDVYLNVIEWELDQLKDEEKLEYIHQLLQEDEGFNAEEEALIKAQIEKWEEEEKNKTFFPQKGSFEQMAGAKKFKRNKLKPVEKVYQVEDESEED